VLATAVVVEGMVASELVDGSAAAILSSELERVSSVGFAFEALLFEADVDLVAGTVAVLEPTVAVSVELSEAVLAALESAAEPLDALQDEFVESATVAVSNGGTLTVACGVDLVGFSVGICVTVIGFFLSSGSFCASEEGIGRAKSAACNPNAKSIIGNMSDRPGVKNLFIASTKPDVLSVFSSVFIFVVFIIRLQN